MNKFNKSIYLRSEINNSEFRTVLIPNDAIELINNGWTIYVEKSNNRIYTDEQYLKVGCELTNLPWYHETFSNSLIIGLKQFENIEYLNSHIHIYFAHSYQKQVGSKELLNKFSSTNSILYDLEYFINPSTNIRLVSFGFWAGVIGTGLALLEYLEYKINNTSIKNLISYDNYGIFLTQIKDKFELISIEDKFNVKIGIIGSEGNCGRGAQNILEELEFKYIKINRDYDKTKLVEFDILINCIKLDSKYDKVWFDEKTIFNKQIIISDVSCDYTKPNNPIKLYNKSTTWNNPVFKPNEYIKIIAIDNLPSLIPKESSKYFSNLFVKILNEYPDDFNKIWKKNYNFFIKNIK